MSNIHLTPEEESRIALARLEAEKQAAAARREQFENELREIEEKAAAIQEQINTVTDQLINLVSDLRKTVSQGHALCNYTADRFPIDNLLPGRVINNDIPAKLRAGWNKILGFKG